MVNIFIENPEIEKTMEILPSEISSLIVEDLTDALSNSRVNLTAESNIINRENFDSLKEFNFSQAESFFLDPREFEYLLVVNIGILEERADQMFISGSLFNSFLNKEYVSYEGTFTRGLSEQVDLFILNSLSELEVVFFPLNKIIENKELPVTGSILFEKSELIIPYDKEVRGKIVGLLNSEGEDIGMYLGGNVEVALRLVSPSYGTVTSGSISDGWTIVTADESGVISFVYTPPENSEDLDSILVKEVIEMVPVFYGEVVIDRFKKDYTLVLRKAIELTPTPDVMVSEPTPVPEVVPASREFIEKLRINIGFTHYESNYPSDMQKDYAEVLILLEDKPLKEAEVEVFSFDKNEEPPLSEIYKGTYTGGVILKEEHSGFYCAGQVPVLLSKLEPVTFYEGGYVILKIKYKGQLLGMKSFLVPSFLIVTPENGKVYSEGKALKAEFSYEDKNITSCTWYNYKIDKEGNRIAREFAALAQSDTSLTFMPSCDDGKETSYVLGLKADIQDSTELLDPEGYWSYTISNIREVFYKISPKK